MPEPYDKFSDPFAPPREPCEVECLHCQQTYESWQIEWRDMPGTPIEGAWCCPTAGCDGVGFGFDILPTDPNYRSENGGWSMCEDEDEEDEDDQEMSVDVFDADALWIDPRKTRPRKHGDTPQPPYSQMPPGLGKALDGDFADDDIPF